MYHTQLKENNFNSFKLECYAPLSIQGKSSLKNVLCINIRLLVNRELQEQMCQWRQRTASSRCIRWLRLLEWFIDKPMYRLGTKRTGRTSCHQNRFITRMPSISIHKCKSTAGMFALQKVPHHKKSYQWSEVSVTFLLFLFGDFYLLEVLVWFSLFFGWVGGGLLFFI